MARPHELRSASRAVPTAASTVGTARQARAHSPALLGRLCPPYARPSHDIVLACDRPGDSAMIDRRLLIGLMYAAAAAPAALSQPAGSPVLKRARPDVVEIAYEESGPETGFPVLLMHGFPY